MRKYLLFILLIYASSLFSQEFINVSGRVFDKNREPIIGASVIIYGTNYGTYTDTKGSFYLKIPKGYYKLKVSHINYVLYEQSIDFEVDTLITVYLSDLEHNIEGVEVLSSIPIVSKRNLSMINAPVSILKGVGYSLGQFDILKTLVYLPGIQMGMEGTSQVVIRGGNIYDNKIIIDDIPIYHFSHIFGFLSIFNSDAIRNIKIYKGYIPSDYSDFSSGVIDIVTKNGSLIKRNINFQAGLLFFQAGYDGYITKNKLSTSFAFRKSYIGNIIRLFDKSAQLDFYDINFKLRWKINNSTSLSLSLFTNNDVFTLSDSNIFYNSLLKKDVLSTNRKNIAFNNKIVALKYYKVKKNYTYNFVIGSSYYNYLNDKFFKTEVFNPEIDNNDTIITIFGKTDREKIHNFIIRNKVTYFLSNTFKINCGFNAKYQQVFIDKNSIIKKYDVDSTLNLNSANIISSFLFNSYLDFNIKKKFFNIDIGGNLNLYNSFNNQFVSFDPRFNLKIDFTPTSAFQFSYSKLHQFNHILTTSALSMPSDLILPSISGIAPVSVDIYDISFLKKIKKWSLNFSLFYKPMNNLIRYPFGIDIGEVSTQWVNYVIEGKGYSYGLEFFISKDIGKLKGWINYSYIRSFRSFAELNEGQVFPYRYDRPHNLNIVVNYQLSHNWSFNLTWVYYSGHNITLPTAEYQQPFMQMVVIYEPLFYYSRYNNVRIPDYHRLDLALSYHHPGKKSYWSFGIYNVYNRLNPTYLEPYTPGKLIGTSIFPIMPFISYRLDLQW